MQIAAIALVVALSARIAMASPRVEVDAGAACDASGLAARVDTLTGSTAGDGAALHVSIVRDGAAVRARVASDAGDDRERVVEAASCDALMDQLALVVAMAARAAPVTTSQDRSFITTPVVHPALVAELARPAPTEPTSWAMVIGIAESTPPGNTAPELVLGARVRRGRGSLAVELAVTKPERTDLAPMQDIDVTTASLTIAACVHAYQLSACPLASIGIADGSPHGLASEHDATAPLVSLGGRVAWEHAFSDAYAFDVHADLLGELANARFDVDGMTAWSSSRVSLWLGIDVLARIR